MRLGAIVMQGAKLTLGALMLRRKGVHIVRLHCSTAYNAQNINMQSA